MVGGRVWWEEGCHLFARPTRPEGNLRLAEVAWRSFLVCVRVCVCVCMHPCVCVFVYVSVRARLSQVASV